jgi:hypothetical protein
MSTLALVAVERGGYGAFIAGLFVGMAVGFLAGPAVRSWLARREWMEASRQVRLTDEVLARLEADLSSPEAYDGHPIVPSGEDEPRPSRPASAGGLPPS